MTVKELKELIEGLPDEFKICTKVQKHSQFDGAYTEAVEARNLDCSLTRKEIVIS